MTDPNFPESDGSEFQGESPRVAPRSPRAAIEPEQPPEPPLRSQSAKRPWIAGLNGLFSFILFCAFLTFAGIYFVKTRLVADGPLTADMTLVVPARSNTAEVTKLLHNENIISDPLTFEAGVFLNHARGKLKAGEYLFPAHVSMEHVINILREGKSILHPVTIPEGLTSQLIVQRLINYDFLGGAIENIPPEGTLLPDTYNVPRGTSREKILSQMAEAQKKLLNELMAKKPADVPLKTPEEFVTLASIVEKETGKAEERPRVAAVFVNRIKRGMKLQSDPTTIYGIAGGKGALDRPLNRDDLLRPTPYNTYIIEKLPPTPIANPGRAALEAAINPAKTADLYFVADGTGGHAFASTFEEHNKNVAKWRQIERDRGEQLEPESTTPPQPTPAEEAKSQVTTPTPAPVMPDDTKPAPTKPSALPEKPTSPEPNKPASKLDLRLTPQ